MQEFEAVYIHIPFCQSKCLYCDFPSYPEYFPTYVDEYVRALVGEINHSELQLTECATLFIGGGTPSLLQPAQLESILAALYNKGWKFVESSIEINPGTITLDKLTAMRELGINRLSFGVQSFDNRLLKSLGRIHSAAQALDNISLAQSVGFTNINLDIMYGLPEQTVAQVQYDIEQASQIGVKHLSAYALKIEPDTKLDSLVEQGVVQPLADEISEQMYDLVPVVLAQHGFHRYEISNYAKDGYECRHNKVYWRYKPYKAFGVAGCSFSGAARTTNTFDLLEYLKAYQNGQQTPSELEHLAIATRRAEYLFMNLRMGVGFDPKQYQMLFNDNIYSIYKKVIEKYTSNGMLKILPNGNIALTSLGFKYSNILFEELL